MTKLHELAELGQAIWLDYIRRSFIASGGLGKLIDMGLRGITSNPTIFERAIAGSDDYDDDLERMALAGKSSAEIYEALAIADIQQAADLLRPVYVQTNGDDGYVSLEVSPKLARQGERTLAEAKRLWAAVDRPNLMIKIPATREGLPAITKAIAAGINVNVTLIFSLKRYAEVMEAYLQGLEARAAAGEPLGHIASVASFFVSRVDTKVDKRLEEIISLEDERAAKAAALRGVAAVANAKIAYRRFQAVFESERFLALKALGARLQRPLWASTSTKNPAYSDILYVQELIGPHTVNTLPQKTMEAFIDHGEVRLTLTQDVDAAEQNLQALEEIGISMDSVTQELEDEGVSSFARSFETMLESIAGKRREIIARQSGIQANFNAYDDLVERALQETTAHEILPRIWRHDHTAWKPEPAEITNRLGWLHSPEEMLARVPQIEALVYAVQQAGYTHALLLGMGGSSLAPELFSRTFGTAAGYLKLHVLDSTAPGALLEVSQRLDPAKTLYIVSTKSGGTVETLSFFKHFYNQTLTAVGAPEAGDHFIAITDPGSKLVEIAKRYRFRATLLNDPDIGGRFSALSYFGLFPAALLGVDLKGLLASARAAAQKCAADVPPAQNPAALLGVALGELAKEGRNKATFILPSELASFGDWVEQLIAESTGKEGRGILPVVGEPLGSPEEYGDDRVFLHFSLGAQAPGDAQDGRTLEMLEGRGHPVIRLHLDDKLQLGGQFLLWELAIAVAGQRLGLNPFDQPDVEAAKIKAREMVTVYQETGSLPKQTPALETGAFSVYGEVQASTAPQALKAFLSGAGEGDYIAIHAYLQPDEGTSAALGDLRLKLRRRYRLATTLGYGPRFLHSTGQLHKGDSGQGLFIQFTASHPTDVPIPAEAGAPDSAITFGTLQLSQALGDSQALLDKGRRVIRFHLDGDPAELIRQLSLAFD